MAETEQFKPKEHLLFEGKKLDCKKELLNENVFVYGGYWKYLEFENKVAVKGREQLKSIKKKKEATIRIIKKEDCVDGWEKTAEKMIKLNHHNVLRLFGYEVDVANGLRYFALELYSATLYHYCNGKYKGPMPNESQVLYQITNGIDHLHGKGIIHGDLNPLNVVIAAESRPVRMKIGDSGLSQFSYSKQLPESAKPTSSHVRASSNRKSLELCQSKYWKSRKETNVIGNHVGDDIVAAGCILFYYLKGGEHLFGEDFMSVLKNLKGKNPVNLMKLDENHVAYELIKNMIIPPSNGLNWLHMANETFKEALSLQINTNKLLGNGLFGDVYEGKFKGDSVAVKQMTATISEKKFIQREMSYHLELDHVNVVKLFDVSDSADNSFTYMALELCAGTLKDYCENKYNGPKLPPDELVLYQIANGLHYIHSRNLVHRDIKPDSILISMTTPVQMKVSGLSFVKKTQQDMFSQSKICGALLWMAPERLMFLNHSDYMPSVLPEGTIKSDTFSSGCVFFYYLTRGKHPFGNNVTAPANIVNKNPVEFDNYVENSTTDNKIGRILADLIKGMIKGKEEERTGLPEVIKQLATLLSRMDQIKCQLCEVNVPLDKGFYLFGFHPTKAILACASKKKFIFFTAENSSIPFSNWRKQVQLLPRNNHPKNVTALKWNMNGTQLAVGYDCNTLVVWNYPECEILFEKKHSAEINEIKWNPTRPNVLATFCFRKKNVSLWDSSPSIGDVITTIDIEQVASVKWISENQIAVCSGGVIKIFKMNESRSTTTTRIEKQFTHGQSWCLKMEWNERTKYLVTCGGNEIKIWSMDSDEPIYCLKDENDINSFAWCPCVRNEDQLDGIEMARTSPENFNFVYVTDKKGSSGDGCCLYIWNPLENEQKPRLLYSSYKHEIDFITFSPDGRFLASQSLDKLIIWSTEDWNPIYKHRNPYTSITGLSWLCSTTSTNTYEKKLIHRISLNEIPEVFEFAFNYEENEISD